MTVDNNAFSHASYLGENKIIFPFDDFGIDYDTLVNPNHKTPAKRYAPVDVANEDVRISTQALLPLFRQSLRDYKGQNKLYYYLCAISSGVNAHQLALENKNNILRRRYDGMLTTNRLNLYVDSQQIFERVIKPNVSLNQLQAQGARQQYPDTMLLVPTAFENFTRALTLSNPLTHHVWDEVDYMMMWHGAMDICDGGFYDNEPGRSKQNFSRNSAIELFRLRLNQMGLNPHAESKDIHILNALTGKDVGIDGQLEGLAVYLDYAAVTNNFRADTAATEALRLVYFIDLLSEIEKPTKACPFDREKLHPFLKNLTTKDFQNMADAKADIVPLLVKQCKDYLNLKDLPAGYLKKLNQNKRTHTPKNVSYLNEHFNEGKAEFYKKPYGDTTRNQQAAAYYLPFDTVPVTKSIMKPLKLYGREEELYDAEIVKLKGNHLPDELNLTQALITAEVAMKKCLFTPLRNPLTAIVATDTKYNRFNTKYCTQNNIPNIYQAISSTETNAENFYQAVEQPSEEEANRLISRLRADGYSQILTTAQIKVVEKALSENKYSFSSPGPAELGPTGRLELEKRYLNEFGDTLFISDDWHLSPRLSKLVTLAYMAGAGYTHRPPGLAQAEMTVYQYSNNEEDNNFAIEELWLPEAKDKLAEYLISAYENDVSPQDVKAQTHSFMLLNDLTASLSDALHNKGKTPDALIYETSKFQITHDRQRDLEVQKKMMPVLRNNLSAFNVDELKGLQLLYSQLHREGLAQRSQKRLPTQPSSQPYKLGHV